MNAPNQHKPCPVCRTPRAALDPCRVCDRAERLVAQEIHHCASRMVHAITFSALSSGLPRDLAYHAPEDDLRALMIRPSFVAVHSETHEESPGLETEDDCEEWVEQEHPDSEGLWTIEERMLEALEHWIVSDWRGGKLQDRGEIVGERFDVTIWGRQTSGQALSSDAPLLGLAVDLLS